MVISRAHHTGEWVAKAANTGADWWKVQGTQNPVWHRRTSPSPRPQSALPLRRLCSMTSFFLPVDGGVGGALNLGSKDLDLRSALSVCYQLCDLG